MRRAVGVLVVMLVFGAVSVPAAAAKSAPKPPTAMSLVNKIVKTGVCDQPEQVNATGSIAQCTDTVYAIKGPVEVHAFKTRPVMLRDLDRAIAAACASFGPTAAQYFHPQYRVGPTWWTHPYRDLVAAGVQKAIGGTIRTYACT